VGPSGATIRNRSNLVKFPNNWSEIKSTYGIKVPILSIKHSAFGPKNPSGKKLIKTYGLTPEQRLAAVAPAEAKSLPERLVYGWCVAHQISFSYQVAVLGGRAVPGGQVLDFVIYDKVTPICIRIQSYWHTGAGNVFKDDLQLDALLKLGYVVEDIWEYQINTVQKLDIIMRNILFGAPRYREVV
jgi:hypothetical protein